VKPAQLLQRGDLFSDLSEGERQRLADASEARFVEPDTIFVRAEMPQHAVVFVAEGKVSLYRKNVERDVMLLLGIVEAPSLFGDAEAAAGVPWMISARAEERTWCVMIPNAIFFDVVAASRPLAYRLYVHTCVRHLLANHTAQSLALYDVETRLIRLLLDFARRFGRVEDDAAFIEKPLSQIEMAASLGVSRKTIARALKPLEEKGVVSRSGEEAPWVVRGLDAIEKSLPKHLLGLSSRFGEPVIPLSSKTPSKR
jgi:CRP/FNR family transcriptional regulator, cyclic AMP receptor protein